MTIGVTAAVLDLVEVSPLYVLFILLIIVGCSCAGGYGYGGYC
ncbi:MAG: sporulation protein YjcZ [Bacillota bacterium]